MFSTAPVRQADLVWFPVRSPKVRTLYRLRMLVLASQRALPRISDAMLARQAVLARADQTFNESAAAAAHPSFRNHAGHRSCLRMNFDRQPPASVLRPRPKPEASFVSRLRGQP
jgi:hypothetical protein